MNFGIDPANGGESRGIGILCKRTVGNTEAIRSIHTPYEIHPWNTVSSSIVLTYRVDFFNGRWAPIPSTAQVRQWKDFFNVMGLVCFAMFVLAFGMVLLDNSYFSMLKAGQVAVAQPAPNGKASIWLWVSLVLTAYVSGYFYPTVPPLVNTPGIRPVFFLRSPVFFIGVSAVVKGLFAVVLMVIGWFFFGGKAVSLNQRGVTLILLDLWKTILLVLAVVAGAFAIAFIADYLFEVDFRFWVIPVRAFSHDKFGIILMYLPFFRVFYVLHSIAVSSFNYVKQGREWVNVAVLALLTTLGAVVYVVIQYGTFRYR